MKKMVRICRTMVTVALILSFCFVTMPRVNAAGSHLDYAFSSDGKVLTDFGTPINPTRERAFDAAATSSGKIVVVGYSNGAGDDNFAVARYNADGTLDTSFSGNGKLTTDFGSFDQAHAVVTQLDGKILVGGSCGFDFAVARYNSDGSLDTTFDGDGKLVFDLSGDGDEIRAIAVQPDGKIMLAGIADFDWGVVRLNSNGSFDNTFDGNGRLITDFGGGYISVPEDIVLEPNGKIVLGGYAQATDGSPDFAIARYNTDGSLDTDFHFDGKATCDIEAVDEGHGLRRTVDGKYLLAGRSNAGTSFSKTAIVRFTFAGLLDTGFGTGGRVVTDFYPDGPDGASDVVIRSNGEFVIAGTVAGGGSNHLFLARYKLDGTLDPTFGTGGRVITPFGNGSSQGAAVFFQPELVGEGKLIAAGTYFYPNNGGEDFALARYKAGGTAATADFSNDGQADHGVFRPGTGTWYMSDSATSSVSSVQFGANGDIAVPGDYDQDGKTDAAVFRPSNGTWYILRSSNQSFAIIQFGAAGDKPVQADFDGDGFTDVAVFRPSNTYWYHRRTLDGDIEFNQFGLSDDLPAPADFDADGVADMTVFRPSTGTWYIQRSMRGFMGLQFGAAGDRPMPVDYDGDAIADIAVFRPSTGSWYGINSQNNSIFGTGWGTPGDIPAPADFDADGKADLTVFRPSNGTWYTLRSKTGTPLYLPFGLNGDVPVSSAYGPQ